MRGLRNAGLYNNDYVQYIKVVVTLIAEILIKFNSINCIKHCPGLREYVAALMEV